MCLGLPLFNGGKVGFESEIHQNQVHVHKEAFQQIHSLTHVIRNKTIEYASNNSIMMSSIDAGKRLPTFIRPLTCRKFVT